MDDTLTESPPPTGRRERNKAEKRARITTAATELFAEHGFERTTTAAVAERAGIGTGTLYLYVNSKEDLLVLVFCRMVGEVWDEAFDQADPDQPLLDQLLTIFNHVAAYHERDTNLSRAYFKELRFVGPTVAEDAIALLQDFHRRVSALLEACQRAGRLDPDVVPVDLTDNLFAVWFLLMQRRHAGRISHREYREEIERGLRTALFRLTPPSGRG